MNSLVVLAVVLVVATVTVINAETTTTAEVVPLVEETNVDPATLVEVQRNNVRDRITRRLQRRLERLLSSRARFLGKVNEKINAETTTTAGVVPLVEDTTVDPATIVEAQRNNVRDRTTSRLQRRLLSIRATFLRNVDGKIAVTKAALANLDELVNNLITLPNQRPLRLSTILALAEDLNASNPEATDVSRRRRSVDSTVSPENATEDEDDGIVELEDDGIVELEEEMVNIMSELELKADE